MKPLLLDLCCGAGGAAKGYADAGFEVVGMDIKPQPNYPFEFYRADAMFVLQDLLDGGWLWHVNDDCWSNEVTFWLGDFDAIHASPPCQAYSGGGAMPGAGQAHPELIAPMRELLTATGLPYVIENVVRAPLEDPVLLCGTSFGLGADGHDLARHRLFETSWPFPLLSTPACRCGSRPVIGIYGDRAKTSRGETLTIRSSRWSRPQSLEVGAAAMGIDWMTWRELREAIPPVFTEHVGAHLLNHIEAQRKAAA